MIRDKLYLANVDPEATNEEIKELVEKYSKGQVYSIDKVELKDESVEHAYLIHIHYENLNELNNTVLRLHDLWWKNRHLVAHLML